jgi:uncharacterized protein YjbJ (UPF0337 family)
LAGDSGSFDLENRSEDRLSVVSAAGGKQQAKEQNTRPWEISVPPLPYRPHCKKKAIAFSEIRPCVLLNECRRRERDKFDFRSSAGFGSSAIDSPRTIGDFFARPVPRPRESRFLCMKSSTKDKIKGSVNQAKGAIKEKAGKASGDADLQDRGTAERVGGTIQKKVGDVKKVFGK